MLPNPHLFELPNPGIPTWLGNPLKLLVSTQWQALNDKQALRCLVSM